MSAYNKYFQDELLYLRELGREFGRAYPLAAPMLADRGADPDVERLLEGVAFLTGRIRQKLDDELPEAIHSIAALLFPQLLRPLPGCAILELSPLPSAMREPTTVPAGAEFGSVSVEGTSCRFRSSWDMELIPWSLEDARLESLTGGRQQLRISMRVDGSLPVGDIAPAKTRFHLAGDVHAAFDLLMWISTYLEDAVLAEPRTGHVNEREISLGKAVQIVGYHDDEALLPLASSMFPGFRLIEEYYTLPQKFAFFDIEGLGTAAAFGATVERFDILLRFTRALPPEFKVDRDWLKLHCVPVANVFPTTAEPIRVTPTREQFLVRPAGLSPGHAEVYAILAASAVPRGSVERVLVPSFFDFSHADARASGAEAFYTTHLSTAIVGDGTDVSISFGSAENSGPVALDADVVSLDLLATNGKLAGALRAGDISSPIIGSPAVATFRNLGAVTPPVPVTLGRELHWRAIAHAAMGLRSLATVEVLRGMLDIYNRQALYDRHAARANELRVAAIQAVKVSPLERLYRGAPVRGVSIDVDVDEKGFLGDGDVFVFSAILDRLFASYVSINSFSRTSLRGTGTNLRFAWPPRSGNETLL